MKSKIQVAVFIIFAFCLYLPSVNGQDTEMMTNAEVITLTRAGVNKDIIINKIKSSKTNFELGTDRLIELKNANVDDQVVLAMLDASRNPGRNESNSPVTNYGPRAVSENDPLAPHPHGIYLFEIVEGAPQMTRLTPSVSAQNRKDGLVTSKLTHGIVKVKIKAKLPGASSGLRVTDPNPVFYFYLDPDSGGLNTASGIPATTREFVLVRFEIKNNYREITIAEANPFLERGGIPDKFIVKFKSEQLGDGIFRVTPETRLTGGEYAFYLINSGNSNTTIGGGAKFFDFTVR